MSLLFEFKKVESLMTLFLADRSTFFLLPFQCVAVKCQACETLMNLPEIKDQEWFWGSRDGTGVNNSVHLCAFHLEIFASHLGSVESLRKANNVPGNSSSYRNLHCSICARVKHDPISQSSLSSRPQAPICDKLFCTANVSCYFVPTQLRTLLVVCFFNP